MCSCRALSAVSAKLIVRNERVIEGSLKKGDSTSMASQSRELNLRTSTCAPVFAIASCYGKNFVGNMLINVILAAGYTDMSRDIFYDEVISSRSKVTVVMPSLLLSFLQMTHFIVFTKIIHSVILHRQEVGACAINSVFPS